MATRTNDAEAPKRLGRYAGTLLVGLLAAVLDAFAVSQPWLVAVANQPGIPLLQVQVSGTDLHPVAGALSLLVLAGFGAVVATRGLARRGVGLVISAAAVVVLAAAVLPGTISPLIRQGLSAHGWAGSAPYTVSWQVWRWLAAAASMLCLGAGWLVVRFGPTWPSLGTRYDAPAASDAPPTSPAGGETASLNSETTMWRALDEGRDPTQAPDEPHVTMGPATSERDAPS